MKLVIFDLDGTLVKIPINYDKIRKSLQILFKTNDDFIPLIPTIKNFADNETVLGNAMDIICQEEIAATNGLIIMDKATELLKSLSNMGFILALATMQCQTAVDVILSKIQVKDLFSCIQTRDNNLDKKSQICNILQELKIDPSQVVVVGDRMADIESASKAGCAAVLVGNANFTHNAKFYSISNLSELLHLDFFVNR